MLWASYGTFTGKGVQGLVAKPQDRGAAVAKLLEAYGGKLISYHMLLNGDIDFFIVSEMPDDKIANVVFINSMLVRGVGAVQSLTTVPAMQAEDAVEQMETAQKMSTAMAYQAPSKS